MSLQKIGYNYMMQGANALPDISLIYMMTSTYFRAKEQFPQLDHYIHISPSFTYIYPMRILAKTRIGSEHMLRVFHCFNNDVYYGIFLSIILISCVISVHKNSLGVWLNTFWAYLTSLFSEYHSFPSETIFHCLMSCPWLMGCVVMFAAFSVKLKNQILKGEDIYWIDSLRDLKQWKDITKLQYVEFSDFNNYLIKNDTDPLRQYLNTKKKECYNNNIRVNTFSKIHSDCQQIVELDYQGLKDGTTAIILCLSIIEVIKRVVLYKFDWKEDINYHVSKSDLYSHPVFTITNKHNLEKHLEEGWDKSYVYETRKLKITTWDKIISHLDNYSLSDDRFFKINQARKAFL